MTGTESLNMKAILMKKKKTKLLTAVKGCEPFPERANLISFYRESVFAVFNFIDFTVWLAHIYNSIVTFYTS